MPEAIPGHRRRFCLRSTVKKDELQSTTQSPGGECNGSPDLITWWKRKSF
jgi:hypothetical protein